MWTIALSITASCYPGRILPPHTENHPRPALAVQTDIYWTADCLEANGVQKCPPESPLGRLGCDAIQSPDNLFGGLAPGYPIYLCLATGNFIPGTGEGQYLYNRGCLLPKYVSFVIWQDGGYQVLRSLSDFQGVYAPIETENEALSYALAVTGLEAKYGLEPQPGTRYLVDKLEDTFVLPTGEGYHVHLYDYQMCGCGPHTTYAVDVLVTQDGNVQELNRWRVYENPDEDNLCID